ncbi:MAG TPA: ATP-binding protein [Bryobacteraceae bacterium]
MTTHVQPKTRRRLAALFSVPLAFSLVFFFVNQAAEHRETRLLEVQRMANSILQLQSHARDAESGERGFYLTGDPAFLEPLTQAKSSLAEWERQSQAYAADRPAERPQVDRLLDLVNQRFRQADEGIARKNGGAFTPETLAAHLNREQETMNQLRAQARGLSSRLGREEFAILDSQRTYSRGSFVFFFTGSLLMILVIVWLYNALLRYLAERDIANAKLKTANVYLEARIEERTRDLTNANDELQQFAYLASHDLQEPLRTITSFSQLLALRYQGRLDAEADEFIGYIITASRRMTDLINGLLTLVRLRKSGQPTERVSFEKLLEQAEISLQAAIRESQAEIEHGPLPSLVVDPIQLSQVLQNLISNAIKYRREEPPRIQIRAERDAGDWVFSIRDNGQGFNPQFADKIFGLFQRLHDRDVEGTGMGLSIARKIIERHGGRIWAISEPGVGSTFFFSLPASLEWEHPAPVEASDSVALPR